LDAACFSRVVVATEDQEIADVCRSHGLDTLLTPSFPTGTDRVAWAAGELSAPWVVNLQGDEPVFPLDLLRDLAEKLPSDPSALWTAADLSLSPAERTDPDVVKILLDDAEPASALDFHRRIPSDARSAPWAVHVGVYAGSLDALERFSRLEIPPEEVTRRIEPLRALAHGMPVLALRGRWNRAAVDRREHISKVLDQMQREGAP
jgi:3-deoxy-manno-octulosonate cytidylyltransferase (CMP-KDO synthetase)